MRKKASLTPWLALFAALVVVNYTLPYTVLTEVPELAGPFLFWLGVTLVAILAALTLSSRWRD